MDIMLERILSLIPQKPDGKFVHGALKEFANSVGLKSGNLVADWMSGRSTSYKNYVYQISAKYNVSVEWLKGETENKQQKKPILSEDELNASLIKRLTQLSPQEIDKVDAFVQGLLASR